jgi:Uncharacterised nucleotidyltransferase
VTATEKVTDAYELARQLLAAQSIDSHDLGSEAAALIPLQIDESARASIWGKLAEEAELHGVAPLLQPVLSALATTLAVPDEVRRVFVALACRHRRAAVAREACIDELLEAFAAASVPIVLLKGAVLAHRIYPRPALRPMFDIDVLIDPADAEWAVNVARDIGYAFSPRHASRFAGRWHHLPVATMLRSGFRIALEIHFDAMSPNQAASLTLATLTAKLEPFRRRAGPDGLALGHTDMLRHLAHHAFEPARRLRLVHLYDLWRYQTIFRDEIDWRMLAARFPEVIIILRLVSHVFPSPCPASSRFVSLPIPSGVGLGMVPLSEIAAANIGVLSKLAAVFNPPAWWLHGFYGVPLENSLLMCRTVRHPVTMLRWLAKRLMAVITAPMPLPGRLNATNQKPAPMTGLLSVGSPAEAADDPGSFNNDLIHAAGLDEEFSITELLEKRAKGFDVTNQLALQDNPNGHSPELARHNLYWYLPTFKEVCPTFKWQKLWDAPDHNWIALNPSVTRHRGELCAIVRTVNYKIDEEGRYCSRTPQGQWAYGTAAYWENNPIITRNYLVRLDQDLKVRDWAEVLSPNDMQEPRYKLVIGFEDMRLFSWKDELWTSSCVREMNAEGYSEQVIARIGQDARIDYLQRMLRSPRLYEKNWAPIVRGEDLLFMYRLGHVVGPDGTDLLKNPTGVATDHISGSSQYIPYQSGWLAITHEAQHLPGKRLRYYMHRFAWFDDNYKLRALSKPFVFNDKAIEFVAGLCWHPNQRDLVLSYGHRDGEARIGTVKHCEVREWLGFRS